MPSGKAALSAEALIGVEKRRVKTLAEQVFAKSKEEEVKDRKEAEEFVKKMNGQQNEIKKRKKEQQEAEKRKQREKEEKKVKDEEEAKAKAEEQRKQKVETLQRDIRIREEQRRQEQQESNAKVDEVLSRKPLYKQKEEVIRNLELSELERKKENLKHLRSLSKPIDNSELEMHKQKYLELKEAKDREKTDKRERILLEIEEKNRSDQEQRSKYNLVNRQAALDRYNEERSNQIESDKLKEQEKHKMSERVNNYSRYVKEMYFPKASKAKNDEIDGIISRLKIDLSHDSLPKSSPGKLSSNNSILKLREIKSSLNSPSRSGHGKNAHSALKTLDKYSMAVRSIMENKEAEDNARAVNHIDWKGKVNPMVPEKYARPQPAEYHDTTVRYLNELRSKRKTEGVSLKARLIDRVINDPSLHEYDRLHVVRQHAHNLEKKAQRDELVLMHAGNLGVDREMEVNDMYLDAISAKLKLLDKI